MYDNFINKQPEIRHVSRKEIKKKIGERIVEIRESKGWTQSELARLCDKDRQAIEKIESGKVNPTLFTLWELADGLKIPLREFLDF
mgnify:FL=1